MPEKINGPAGMARAGERDQAIDIGDRVIHAIDQRSRSRGLAVTTVIECVNGEVSPGQPRSDVRIAPGVFADAVSEDHYGTRRAQRKPCLPVNLSPGGTGEETLRILLDHLWPNRGAAFRQSHCVAIHRRIGLGSVVHRVCS
jgi:hypothetical protein